MNSHLPDDDGALAQAGALASLIRDTAGRYADLFAAELRRAGLSATLMMSVAIILAVLVAGVWSLLCAAIAVGLWQAGFPLAACLLALAVLNAVAAVAALVALRALSRGLTFAATRRSLESPEEVGDAPAPSHG